MIRSNHYETAFEAYLRSRGVGFIAVDEARRSLLGPTDVKSLDFIIVGPESSKLVVDVKGRKFPGGSAENPRKVWQNWSTEDDVDGLNRWAGQFGAEFRGILAFVYQIVPPFCVADDTPDRFVFKNDVYLMRAIEVTAYRSAMTARSAKWGTVHLPTEDFRRLVRPFSDFLQRPVMIPTTPLPQTVPVLDDLL